MKALVIGVHMDDCEYGVGGTTALLTQKGVDVTFLNIKPYKHYSGGDIEANKQSTSAAQLLGANKITLDYTGTRYYKNNETTVRAVEQVIRDISPDILFTMHPHDNHIEHSECARTAHEAIFAAAVDGVCPNEIYTYEVGPLQNMCYFIPQLYIEITPAEQTLKNSIMSFASNNADGEWLWREKERCAKFRGHESMGDISEAFRILKFPDASNDFILRSLLNDNFSWQGTKMYYPGEGATFF